jgi:hypothetical protein
MRMRSFSRANSQLFIFMGFRALGYKTNPKPKPNNARVLPKCARTHELVDGMGTCRADPEKARNLRILRTDVRMRAVPVRVLVQQDHA